MESRVFYSEAESTSKNDGLVLNPADDSSSSYRQSSISEDERREEQIITEGSSAVGRRRGKPARREKAISGTPSVTQGHSLDSRMDYETRTKTGYSDEWIKEDAARWAMTFMGPVYSENPDKDENHMKLKPRPFRNRSKRRNTEEPRSEIHKAKRRKGLYNDNYRQLLNEEIRSASLAISESHDRLPQSQIGVTIWTSAEKESFFVALSRLGKDNVRGVASTIGTKSELEIQEYIHLLRQGILDKTANEPRRHLLGFADIPAAVQLSQECCDELDKAADALGSRQTRYEEQKEQQNCGELRLLNSTIILRSEEYLTEEGSSHEIKDVLSAAELLNLSNWLDLSSRIFMNPAAPREEENWHFLAEPGEEPSMRLTAFQDFHRLAISVTKRLISTTIFCTMSRLRAMDSKSFHRYDIVKPTDVEAAVKIVGFETSSYNFWRYCPRRCNLNITNRVPAAGSDPLLMKYDEVEDILNPNKSGRPSTALSDDETSQSAVRTAISSRNGSSGSSSPPLSSESELEIESGMEDTDVFPPMRDLAFEHMVGVELEQDLPIDPSGSEYGYPLRRKKRIKEQIAARQAHDQAQAEYTEAVDMQNSLSEEQRLWRILNQEPPFTVNPEQVIVPQRPVQERKRDDEVKDWRDRMEFWSLWETLDRPVPTSAFLRSSVQTAARCASASNKTFDRSTSKATNEEIEGETSDDSSDSNSLTS